MPRLNCCPPRGPGPHGGLGWSTRTLWATSMKNPGWVPSFRTTLSIGFGLGEACSSMRVGWAMHALVLLHGAVPRPARPGMIDFRSIAKPPGRIRHGNGRVWKYWWPMWPLSPTGLWWPNMLYWASVSILGRRNPGIFFQVLRQHDPWWFARTLNGLKRVPIARERGWLNPLESGSKTQGAKS